MSRILDRLKGLPTPANSNRAATAADGSIPSRPSARSTRIIAIALTVSLAIGASLYGYSWLKPKPTPPTPVQISALTPLQEQNQAALAALKKNDLDQAARLWREVIVKNPDRAELFVNLAMVYRKQNQLNKAEQTLAKALDLNPTLSVAHNNLGMIHLLQGEYDKAIEHFSKVQNELPEALLNMARAYEAQFSMVDALQAYEKYLAHPQSDAKLVGMIKARLPRIHSLAQSQRHSKEGA